MAVDTDRPDVLAVHVAHDDRGVAVVLVNEGRDGLDVDFTGPLVAGRRLRAIAGLDAAHPRCGPRAGGATPLPARAARIAFLS